MKKHKRFFYFHGNDFSNVLLQSLKMYFKQKILKLASAKANKQINK